MNNLVTFEKAKLLKEKGLDIATKILYNDEGYKLNNGYYPDIHKDDIAAPTIAEVVMRLYEKHGIWISVSCPIKIHPAWFFSIFKVGDDGNDLTNGIYEFNSPTEAYEIAIDYTLKNLI